MTLKDIALLVSNQEDSAEASQTLTKKIIVKVATLNVVALLIFGVALVYTIRDYQTFTGSTQKYLLIILSGFFVVISTLGLVYLNRTKITPLAKLFKLFKWLDTVQFLTISLLIVLHIITFYVFTAEVFQSSMNPTLQQHDRLIVYQFDYTPKRNDVVVIFIDGDYYGIDESHYVKRVVGLPGDTIAVNASNQLLINGIVVQDLPLSQVDSVKDWIEFLPEGKIMDGFYFVLGDNVANSHDSRNIGFIREQDIKAKVIFRFYPKVGVIE
ncbi:MAG: signal peptidase I [Acholeplasma sp.]|jgi:signal peptidase I|nr:signal peptidase I [Acholeplasma sp.]